MSAAVDPQYAGEPVAEGQFDDQPAASFQDGALAQDGYEEGYVGEGAAPSNAGAAAAQREVDPNGGFYDEQGLYHDGMGGMYDADGNYYYDEAQAAGGYDEENPDMPDASYEKEEAGCCKSFMTSVYPLMITIIVLNTIMIILGAVVLGMGVYILEGGNVQLSGFSNIEGVVTSSPYVFSIISIVLGAIIILFATLGIAISKYMATGGMYGFIRCMYFVYQSFMILVFLILLAICILSGVGLGLTKGDNGYSADAWGDNTVLNPSFTCQQEYRLECSGYSDYDCQTSGSLANTNCPGYRCIDFCRVDQSVQNDVDLCKECIAEAPDFDFAQCKDFELRFAFNGCQDEINADLRSTYELVIIVTSIACFFVILTITAASWKSCSCCQ
mmetsp:Transcript_13002/g.35007  ORF Transcript_13002/g.35007 Transcript_13002/m.35007 type:complete len:386 (-) Transcript_13002:337-1494(-)